MVSKHSKMYSDSPKMERDDETGKVVVKREKGEAKGGKKEDMKEGAMGDAHARHAMDRLALHHKHENEHHAHKGGEKHEMHERHHSEMKAMHRGHEKEMASGEKTGGGMIEKVEKDGKE